MVYSNAMLYVLYLVYTSGCLNIFTMKVMNKCKSAYGLDILLQFIQSEINYLQRAICLLQYA